MDDEILVNEQSLDYLVGAVLFSATQMLTYNSRVDDSGVATLPKAEALIDSQVGIDNLISEFKNLLIKDMNDIVSLEHLIVETDASISMNYYSGN